MAVGFGQHAACLANAWFGRIQMKCFGGRLSDSGSRSGHSCDGANATRVIDGGNGMNVTGQGNPAAQQAAAASAVAVGSRKCSGLIPLRLLQRCGRRGPFGFSGFGLQCRMALAVMQGCLVLMAKMGLGN
mgnify:CR=1 FL=1